MKKILGIVVLSFLLSGNSYAVTVTCTDGECEFYLSTHYESAKTSCYQTLFNEEVETNFMSFTILETGEQCIVWDSR